MNYVGEYASNDHPGYPLTLLGRESKFPFTLGRYHRRCGKITQDECDTIKRLIFRRMRERRRTLPAGRRPLPKVHILMVTFAGSSPGSTHRYKTVRVWR